VKKSTASTPAACARRNCRQESADRLGAGSTPARWRMDQTVLAPILPCTRGGTARRGCGGTPRSVLPGQPQHQRAELGRHSRTATPAGSFSGVGPGLDASAAASRAGRTTWARPASMARSA
jgi:hypothetical protein